MEAFRDRSKIDRRIVLGSLLGGMEGNGREGNGRDVVPIHSYVRRPLGSWMVDADAPTGDIR